MDFILILAGAGLFFAFIIFGLPVVKLRAIKLQPAIFTLVDGRFVPPELRAGLRDQAQKLGRLGFRFSHFQSSTSIVVGSTHQTIVAIAWHEQERCYVEIAEAHDPSCVQPFYIRFVSILSNEEVLITHNLELHGAFERLPGLHIFDAHTTSLDEHWAKHRKLRERALKGTSVVSTLVSPADYISSLNQHELNYLDSAAAAGFATKTVDNVYELTWSGARTLVSRMRRGGARKATLLKSAMKNHETVPEWLSGPQHRAHLSMDAQDAANTLDRWIKFGFFAASALAFAVIFGSVWSYSFVLLLIPVLLFHELGHFVAMRIFGYTDLQMLFLPIGAAVIGKKSDIPAWQQVVVSLAGPVPGIIAAALIWLFAPDNAPGWVNELAIVLFILNFINLLPIMPLDGGHVVNTLLLGRAPGLQTAFIAVSLVISVLGAWYFRDPILLILSAALLSILLGQVRTNGLIKSIPNKLSELSESDRIRKLYAAMNKLPAWRTELFQTRYQTIKNLVQATSHRPTRWWEAIAGMSLYGSLLLAPVLVAATLFWPAYNESHAEASEEYERWEAQYNQFEQEDKRAVLDAIEDPGTRLDKLLEYINFIEEYEIYGEQYDWMAKEAAALADQIGRYDDTTELVFYRQIENLTYSNQQDLALAEYDRYLENFGQGPDDYLFEILVANAGSYEKGLRIADRYSNRTDISLDGSVLARLAEQEGLLAEAEVHWRSAIDNLMNSDEAQDMVRIYRGNLADNLELQGRYEESIAIVNQNAAQFDFADDEFPLQAFEANNVFRHLAWLNMQQGDFAAAKTNLQKVRASIEAEQDLIEDSLGLAAMLVDYPTENAALAQLELDYAMLAFKRGDHLQAADRLNSWYEIMQELEQEYSDAKFNPAEKFNRFEDEEGFMASSFHIRRSRDISELAQQIKPEWFTN